MDRGLRSRSTEIFRDVLADLGYRGITSVVVPGAPDARADEATGAAAANGQGEPTAKLRGLIRAVDARRWRHVYAFGDLPGDGDEARRARGPARDEWGGPHRGLARGRRPRGDRDLRRQGNPATPGCLDAVDPLAAALARHGQVAGAGAARPEQATAVAGEGVGEASQRPAAGPGGGGLSAQQGPASRGYRCSRRSIRSPATSSSPPAETRRASSAIPIRRGWAILSPLPLSPAFSAGNGPCCRGRTGWERNDGPVRPARAVASRGRQTRGFHATPCGSRAGRSSPGSRSAESTCW